MIGKLKGKVDEIGDDYVIVDVHGVGYVVFASARVLGSLPAVGQEVVLFIEMYVREDVIKLFGFSSKEEQDWFKLLQNVQGVGAKVALSILGTMPLVELSDAIMLRDLAMMMRAPGVGKRVAERILTELHDKAPSVSDGRPHVSLHQKVHEVPASSMAADAVSALSHLGYSNDQAAKAVAAALRAAGADADSSVLIRLGLKELSR